MENIPILRLELEGMKFSLYRALDKYQVEWNKMVRNSIERYCNEENLQLVIDRVVEREINDAIQEEVENFYKYGEGRNIIREIIVKKLQEEKE